VTRILICAGSVPRPPLDGVGLIVDNLVRELGGSHAMRVLGVGDTDPTPAVVAVPPASRSRRARVRDSMRALPAATPPSVATVERALGAALAREAACFDPDVVVLFGPQLAPLREHVPDRRCVFVPVDSWSRNKATEVALRRGLSRAAGLVELATIRRHVRRHWPAFPTIVVVSPEDAEEVRRLVPRTRVVAIPNGVRIPPGAPAARHDAPTVIFHGALGYRPNVRAAVRLAERVMPRVRRAEPDARLRLVGRDPAPEVRGLARRALVEVVGEVPDVHAELARASVFACCMESGSGVKNKVLEAMASRTPVVSTPLGLQGIDARAGEEVLVGAGDEELADLVVQVLRDPGLGARIGAGGRRYVEAHHSWSAVAQRYLDALRSA